MASLIRVVARPSQSKLWGRFLTMAAETKKPVEASIQKKLMDHFQPTFLKILNESHMHKVPRGSETHFRVIVVSEQFENQPLLQRQRMVNTAVAEELKSAVRALSIVAKTPKQWEESPDVGKSPKCRGGAGL